MYHSTVLAIVSLLSFASAVPTPVDLAPRCGTTIRPSFLQTLTQSSPGTVSPNSPTFHVSQTSSTTNHINQVVGFSSIPAGSYGCQLAVSFPASYPITTLGSPILNVKTLFKDQPGAISYPNGWSWNTFYPGGTPIGQGTFGTVTIEPGTTKVINSQSCPVGGGALAFVFSIADWVAGEASVEFTQGADAGVYLTYNC
ncbi:hypothetical protein B0O99DRAFT_528642 [Bisporella sp. PMI_857]|nr:hypothetical protein B0O99DRAFT_528642 [Bisporella sp. PMI_857]